MIRRLSQPEVELPITPMLDMAFQLLTFFILTYRPAPREGQFVLNLLPPQPVAAIGASAGESGASVGEIPAALRTLTTTLHADEEGQLGRLTLDENEIADLEGLRDQLRAIKADKTLPFDQAIIQIDPRLKYADLVRVIDIFADPAINITKISFAAFEPGAAGEEPSL